MTFNIKIKSYYFKKPVTMLLIAAGFFIFTFNFVSAAQQRDVVINEIAWMGTSASASDEWIELYNNTAQAVDLTGWVLKSSDGSPDITLSGTISAAGYFLLERTDDNAVSVQADWTGSFGSGGLVNGGEYLQLLDGGSSLIDEANFSSGWPVGSSSPDYMSMERVDSLTDGNSAANWGTNDGQTRNGTDVDGSPINGTPKARNSAYASSSGESQQSQEDDSSSGANNSNQPPVAQVAAEEIFANVGQEVDFDASGSFDTNGDALTFSWNFGDGSISSSGADFKKVSHTYSYPGKYIVILSVADYLNESKAQILVNIYPLGVLISEFLPNPEGKDEGKEWIEIYNSNSYAADLSGWKLDEFVIPENTIILPKNYLVISSKISKTTLKNNPRDGGEKVELFYPNGEIADSVAYEEKAEEGYSAARKGEKFVWTKNQTPGIQNIFQDESGENFKKSGKLKTNRLIVGGLKNSSKNYLISSVGKVNQLNFNRTSFLATPVFARVSGFDGGPSYISAGTSDSTGASFVSSPVDLENGSESKKVTEGNLQAGVLFGSAGLPWVALLSIFGLGAIVMIVLKVLSKSH